LKLGSYVQDDILADLDSFFVILGLDIITEERGFSNKKSCFQTSVAKRLGELKIQTSTNLNRSPHGRHFN